MIAKYRSRIGSTSNLFMGMCVCAVTLGLVVENMILKSVRRMLELRAWGGTMFSSAVQA